MTEDELRDRIEGIIEAHRTVASGPGDCVCACNRTWMPNKDYRKHLAQAVIDDLGLRVEAARDPFSGGPTSHTRVVGRWRKRENVHRFV